MARNLKKFANPHFLKTCDLALMQRLLERHGADLSGVDLDLLQQESPEARKHLEDFFRGPEEGRPAALSADLYRIADLSNDTGMRILVERARALHVTIVPPEEADADESRHALDARHLALRAFLDHPQVFEAASDFMWLETASLTEFSGLEEGVEPKQDEEARRRFETAAGTLFQADLMGRYCRTGWYEDAGEMNLVVTHGMAVTRTAVVQEQGERILSYRPAGHAVLSYRSEDGRLKVGGIHAAHRPALASIFAEHMLGRRGFFEGEQSRKLYTLAPVETDAAGFHIEHAFDPDIGAARIVEVEVQRLGAPSSPTRSGWEYSVLLKDRNNALERLQAIAPAVNLAESGFRLSHIVVAFEIASGKKRPASVRVKIKPPDRVIFKRERFEEKVMEILSRSGLSLGRESRTLAVAAE